MTLKWRKQGDGHYEACSPGTSGLYEIIREKPGKPWALLVDGEEYSTPGLLAVLKNVAEMLDEDRWRRVRGKPLIDIL